MKIFKYTITDPVGIHARPAGLLVKFMANISSAVTIEKMGKSAEAKRLFSIMGLGAKCGEQLTIKVEGENEYVDAKTLEVFFAENF